MTERSSRWNEGLLVEDGSRSLLDQIAWFNNLRLLAVTGMVATTIVAGWLGLIDDVVPLFVMAGLTLAVDGVYIAVFPRLGDLTTARLRRHVHVQIGLDLVILTVILHFSGGATNPLVLCYLFHTFIAAFLLSLRASIVVAVLSIGLLTLLGFGESAGWFTHRPLGITILELDRLGTGGLFLWLLCLAFVLGISVYFFATILRQLRQRESALVRLSRQFAHSEKLASIGTLAAGVSHEINNPVGVIQHKTQILRYRIHDGDPPEALLSELTTIEKHTRRIRAITEGLLAFARETPFGLRPVRVNDLAREAADLVRVPFKAKELTLQLELDATEPWIEGSPNHLLQVLVNVLLNARDASRERLTVRLSTGHGEAEAWIAIEDQGEGIAEENLGKIFDPFFTTKDVDRGTGLGLALSHNIVERHRGRIEVESEVGRGSRFRVVIPLSSTASPR